MRCPFCDAEKESLKVIDSRACDGGRAIRRRRQCLRCDKRFTTYEKVEEPARLVVVKKDGRRVPWDRTKILRGLGRACFKRPVPEAELVRIADEVEDGVFRTHDREVASARVGQWVTDRLRRVDQVAYVRFASVYRQFRTRRRNRWTRPNAGRHSFSPSSGRRANALTTPPPVTSASGNQ